MKAKWLGKPKLAYWDRNAPLPGPAGAHRALGGGAAPPCSRPTARSRRSMAGIAERFFDRGWIDAPVREGKSPGAFSHPTVPSVHPYILMNYQGKPRDVMTLAHELGHGVHQTLAAPLGPLLAQTPLTLAETASVFGEMLTFKALLASATDAKERKALLAQKVEDMINTVVRQIAFYSLRAAPARGAQGGRAHLGAASGRSGWRCRARAWARRSSSARATRPTGATCPTSSTRRSTSTPTPSATAW